MAVLGGKWDRRLSRYIRGGDQYHDMSLHPGQWDAAEWFEEWMRHRYQKTEMPGGPYYSMLCAGGRRSGKTDLCCKLTISFAVAFPKSICWIVCPSQPAFEEIIREVNAQLPRSWCDKTLGAPWWRWELANGSWIVMRSGRNPPDLKKGRCDFAFFNEGQQQYEKSYINVRAAIADQGGMVIVAANPPDDGDRGTWVGDFAVDCMSAMETLDRGEIVDEEVRQGVYFHLDPLKNPHINQDALRALRNETDQRTFDIEVRGMFLSPKDAVFYNWERIANERRMPEVGDATAWFTKAKEGREFDRVIGIDVQRFPHMVGVEWRFFRNPRHPNDPNKAIGWIASEIVLEGANERDLCKAFAEREWDPERTMLICDASGDWQSAERIKGKGSFEIFRECGYRWVYRPDRKKKANPDISERCAAMCERIKTAAGERLIFSQPTNRKLNACFGQWTTVHGQPGRRSIHAHIGDAVSYAAWRFFPRRKTIMGKIERVPRRISNHESDMRKL